MKIAVAASGPGLDEQTDARFGRCAWFVIVDTETFEFEALENTAAKQGTGAGIAAAQLVADAGAEGIIGANLGPSAFQALSAGGLKMYACDKGTVRESVESLNAGRLVETDTANVAAHSGMGGGPRKVTGLG